ncbi:Spaf_1101 family AAA-like ATPase [Ureibacillus manganicus]|uniref:Rad50/SbcC-type AAA domain-containing protein n=1 Tax=Ureibacillus manganicus DSM 26584 TaxID=1384049 RepID=A0A0A3HVJ8_9BACL|nr:hypothetical protein [Ureibacillus manganicus]KGR74313.1 hypothetical protein CD29_19000 [Ureibacillus manganicus DSM 26584]
MINGDIINVYETIRESKNTYGDLKKCEIHLHTPASHDYRLIAGESYDTLSIESILEYALMIGYLNKEGHQELLNKVHQGDFEGETYLKILQEKKAPYGDFKEYLSYILIAHKLYSEKIEVVLVSDHNTTAGFDKLAYANNEYFVNRIKHKEKMRKHIKIMLGLEITCSDGNHVVAIFDERNPSVAKKFVDDHILSRSEGTFETSYSILQSISESNGIGYIAHINSSDFNGTGFYNKTLFESEYLKILGLTNIQSDYWNSKISSFTKRSIGDFCILHESDAHCIDDIGKRNTWIKFNEISFAALKKAIKDYKVSIYTENPNTTNSYIKGLVVYPGEKGFLNKKPDTNKDNFKITFSRDLTCIIGGRGTGKSTILNILDTVMTQEAQSEKYLRFISVHEKIFVVFTLNNTDYVIRFLPQVNNNYDMNDRGFFLGKAFFDSSFKKNSTIPLPTHWTQLFEVRWIDDKNYTLFEVKSENDKKFILNAVYRKHYSINNIVSKVNNGEVGQFIKDTVYYGINRDYYERFLTQLLSKKQTIFKQLLINTIPELLIKGEENQQLAKEKIEDFNHKNSNLIQIIYSPNEKFIEYYLEEFWFNVDKEKKVADTLLTWEDIENYSYIIVERIGLLKFIQAILERNYEKLENILPMKSLVPKTPKIRDIEKYEPVNKRSIAKIYTKIIDWILFNPTNIISCLRKYFEIADDFTLHFNINSKESLTQNPVFFKNIEELSLGQQVVAILTFIMEYGKCSNDNTPLIIDQPEDNLDNQYIYKNLVLSLRNIKNFRQVIVVTHNSTIVTNADAEQVIVMDSDGGNGWVIKQGYLSDQMLMKYILVHLEGGQTAFKNKMENYKTILNI